MSETVSSRHEIEITKLIETAMSISTDLNFELQLASRFIEETDTNVFLTGKAGTGKTTFLKTLQQQTAKRMIITAPTGVAAINANGVTLHSFFQLPLGPFIPGTQATEEKRHQQFKLANYKRRIISSLDLLVIDEISMVRADLLDAVDDVLRRFRKNSLPFGGVQLLMIGDLHQLPPIAKEEDWQLLRQAYNSVYFFNSHALAKVGFVGIELKHIYRQSDERFIAILNQIRENQLNQDSVRELNKRFIQGFAPKPDQDYITLTTHNARAESINSSKLDLIQQQEKVYTASVSGEFPEHSFPAPKKLSLKKGAQVMFLRNDTANEKQYYNGKIGKIVGLFSDEILIKCPEDGKTVCVEPVTWENIRYSLNKEKTKIEEEQIGTFKQFPLKLAWAVTIHKSQGLTFERVIIDAGAAFVHGQTYVALSRCKSIDGIVLTSAISTKGIQLDRAIAEFDQILRENPPSGDLLDKAKNHYQQKLLYDCFDFEELKEHVNRLMNHLHSDPITVSNDVLDCLNRATQEVFSISRKFKHQLQGLFQSGQLPESDPTVQERLHKASAWFQGQLEVIFNNAIEILQIKTKAPTEFQSHRGVLQKLLYELTVKRAAMNSLDKGFLVSHYLRQVYRAQVDFMMPDSQGSQTQETSGNLSELFEKLDCWRAEKAESKGIAKHQIIRRQVMKKIEERLPTNLSSLKKINGVGKQTMANYGHEIVKLVSEHLSKKLRTDSPMVNQEKQSGANESP